jgi:hypothetical protein
MLTARVELAVFIPSKAMFGSLGTKEATLFELLRGFSLSYSLFWSARVKLPAAGAGEMSPREIETEDS